MICILGDWHLTSSRDYFIEVCEKTLKWFESWSYNSSENELILVGDLVSTSVNGGIVIDFIERLYKSSRFKVMHIIPGNHDLKRKDGIEQLAYEFLRNKEDVIIYDKITEAVVQDKLILFMPHFIPEPFEKSMTSQYSEAYKSFDKQYDLVVGHFNEENAGFGAIGSVLNLSKLKTKKLCLGHIHIRVDPKIYIGSMYATRTGEEDPSRSAWILDHGEDPLPNFCEFTTIRYPEPLPTTNALVSVYTITNCPSEQVAKEKYGDIFIRKVVRSLEASLTVSTAAVVENDLTGMSTAELFTEFKKANVLDRNVAALCSSLLN